jgi:hypothetical protein
MVRIDKSSDSTSLTGIGIMCGAAEINDRFRARALGDMIATIDPRTKEELGSIRKYVDTHLMREFEENHKRTFQGPGTNTTLDFHPWNFNLRCEHGKIANDGLYTLDQ